MRRALATRKFPSLEEAERFVAEILEHGAPDLFPQTPLDHAQELVYRAWESDDPAVRRELARQALRLSEDCADAYVIPGEEAEDLAEAIGWFEKAVEAGEWLDAFLGDLIRMAGTQAVRLARRVGRNDPCPCGSGRKYKQCCGRAD